MSEHATWGADPSGYCGCRDCSALEAETGEPPEHLAPQAWKSYRDSDGELMVSIADVLTWLRNCETAWQGTRDDSPPRVAAWLGDELRDLWLEGTRPDGQP